MTNKENIKIVGTDKEIDFFSKVVNDSKEYFEYGSGGSTLYVYNNTEAKINSIDSSKKWIEKVLSLISNKGRVKIKYVFIGKLGNWGKPVNGLFKIFWPNYSKSIFELAKNPDVIFIDGRFRVACAIQIVLFCLDRGIRPKILLHDCVREEYLEIYNILEPIEKIDSDMEDKLGLQLFEIKDAYNLNELRILFCRYKYDMR